MSSRYFFSKQNTAYEVRISDWSSDVCSSDLLLGGQRGAGLHGDEGAGRLAPALVRPGDHRRLHDLGMPEQHVLDLQRRDVLAARDDDVLGEIGRASGRDRVCQFVSISVGALSLKKTTTQNNY